MLDSRVVRSKSTAFIGLGRMGSEMAYNLFSKKLGQSAESRFVVCDAVPESAMAFRRNFLSQFPGASIDVVQTPEEWVLCEFLQVWLMVDIIGRAVRSSETVITMLPSSPQVQTVYCDQNGIMPGLKALKRSEAESCLFIDSTTLDVNVARQVAGNVILTGAQMIDAPVSGGLYCCLDGCRAAY